MMPCDHCKLRDAVIHLTQIVNNTVTTLHLCEQCAAEKGVETGTNVAKFPLGDFLASMGKVAPGEAAIETGETPRCSRCGSSMKDFRQAGRLGCAQCYVSFEVQLRDLLRRLHGSCQHVGERYRPPSAAPDEGRLVLGELREQLRRAVDSENFELAAELRDRMRVLE